MNQIWFISVLGDYFQNLKIQSLFKTWIGGMVGRNTACGRGWIPVGSEILFSILGQGVCYLCSVQYCL